MAPSVRTSSAADMVNGRRKAGVGRNSTPLVDAPKPTCPHDPHLILRRRLPSFVSLHFKYNEAKLWWVSMYFLLERLFYFILAQRLD